MNKKLVLILLLVVIGMVSALHANVYVTVKNVWYEGDYINDDVDLIVRYSNNAVAGTYQLNPINGESSVHQMMVLNQGSYSFYASQHGVNATVEKYVDMYGNTYVIITLPGPWEIHNPPQND